MKISDSTLVRLIILVIFVAILSTVVYTAWLEAKASDNGQRLSREQQIELMEECVTDAKRISVNRYFNTEGTTDAVLASAFFEYRTREGY